MTAATAGTDYVAPNVAITGAAKTKITYDAKGLVTAGADATTADIAPSTDRNYVTDAQKSGVLSNTSGVNTGDETGSTIKTKLGITTLSGSNTGDQTITLTGDVTGTGTGTFTTTLATTGVTASMYGSSTITSTSVPVITVDAKGRITNAVSTQIPSATSTQTGLLTSADYATFNAKQGALTLGTNVQTFLATPTSANLAAAVTDETGSGTLVFSTNPTLVTPTLGVASATSITSGTLSLTTPLSLSSGGTGTNLSTGTGSLVLATSPTLSGTTLSGTTIINSGIISSTAFSLTGVANATSGGTVLTNDGYGNAIWSSNGVYTLNGISASSQTFSTTTSTASASPSFISSGTAHTLNIPLASATGTTAGLITNSTQSIAGNKTFVGNTTISSTATGTTAGSAALFVGGSISVHGAAINDGATLVIISSGTTTTAIDFSLSNIAYGVYSSAANSPNFQLNNIKSGGTYTFALQPSIITSTIAKCSFTSTGFSFVSLGNYDIPIGKNVLYTFIVIGSKVYISMVQEE